MVAAEREGETSCIHSASNGVVDELKAAANQRAVDNLRYSRRIRFRVAICRVLAILRCALAGTVFMLRAVVMRPCCKVDRHAALLPFAILVHRGVVLLERQVGTQPALAIARSKVEVAGVMHRPPEATYGLGKASGAERGRRGISAREILSLRSKLGIIGVQAVAAKHVSGHKHCGAQPA